MSYFPKLRPTIKDQRFVVIGTIEKNVRLTLLNIFQRGTSQTALTMIESSNGSLSPTATTLMRVDLICYPCKLFKKSFTLLIVSELKESIGNTNAQFKLVSQLCDLKNNLVGFFTEMLKRKKILSPIYLNYYNHDQYTFIFLCPHRKNKIEMLWTH